MTKEQKIPLRVRRGFRRVIFSAECELMAVGKDWKDCGMRRQQFENFKLAVAWLLEREA